MNFPLGTNNGFMVNLICLGISYGFMANIKYSLGSVCIEILPILCMRSYVHT